MPHTYASPSEVEEKMREEFEGTEPKKQLARIICAGNHCATSVSDELKSFIATQRREDLEGHIKWLKSQKKEIFKTPYFKTPHQDKIDEEWNRCLDNQIYYFTSLLEQK